MSDAEPQDPEADHAAGRLVRDLAVGHCFLQLSYTSVGDLGIAEVKLFQARQATQVLEQIVGNFRIGRVKPLHGFPAGN